ncbi:MAG: hypothetical protein F2873_10725, partial [Actinobacteria bacterium]|nr:hypothetical protein [Actinomycetota bacterium]
MSTVDLTPEEYANEYGESRQRIRSIVEAAVSNPATAQSIAGVMVPACPDWTLTNICSHLAGICRDLVERNNPGADAQAWVDRQVAERADRSLGSLLDEWDEYSPRFETLIAKHPHGFSGLVLDVVAHEHDICGALGIEGDRTSRGVHACMLIEARQIL